MIGYAEEAYLSALLVLKELPITPRSDVSVPSRQVRSANL